jgi:hypothetical protein
LINIKLFLMNKLIFSVYLLYYNFSVTFQSQEYSTEKVSHTHTHTLKNLKTSDRIDIENVISEAGETSL